MCDRQLAAFGYTDRFYPRTRIKCPYQHNFLKCVEDSINGIYFRVSVCSQELSPLFYKEKAFLHRLPGWDSNLVKRVRSHWIDGSTAVHRVRLLVVNGTKTTLDEHCCCVKSKSLTAQACRRVCNAHPHNTVKPRNSATACSSTFMGAKWGWSNMASTTWNQAWSKGLDAGTYCK